MADWLLHYTNPVFDAVFSIMTDNPLLMDHDSDLRIVIQLWANLTVLGAVLYLSLATANFYLFFDHETLKHPKILKNQIQREIYLSLASLPKTAVVTVPWFYFEYRGYSKLYDVVETWWEVPLTILGFFLFTDCFVYWIHRGFHHPSVYWWLHKPHHIWKITTPFSALAFHWLDGYGQSCPAHLYVYLFPMWKPLYVLAFVWLQVWSISIHDGVYLSDDEILLSCAHHNIHHLEFNYNYGQYTTMWDRIGGSYKKPEKEFATEMYFDKLRNRRAQKDKETPKQETSRAVKRVETDGLCTANSVSSVAAAAEGLRSRSTRH